jgi:VCBS repeat-containing protein
MVIVNSGGTVDPGAPADVLSTGDLTCGASTTLHFAINGAAPGTGHDQLKVTGAVNLNGATLSGSLGFTPASGETFVLINNDGTDPVVGTFAGLAEGAMVTFGSRRFFISYHGGDGNDVVLTADHAPVAGASSLSYSVNENQVLNVAAPGLLAGASDPDGDPISPVLGTGPAHGSLTLNPDGSFTYTANVNYAGSDGFTYVISDGDLTSALVTVNITVIAINRPPVATNDSYTTNENTPLVVAAPGVLGNDTDPDGDPLSAVLVSGPSHGTLVLNADGSFTYTPNTGYTGSDSFSYKASDGSLSSSTATVSLLVNAVNQAPTAVADSYSTAKNTPLVVAAPGVLANDTDPDGDQLTAVLVSGPSHGTLTLNSNGSFTYTPKAGYTGSDSFTCKASDGSLFSAPVSVALTITGTTVDPIKGTGLLVLGFEHTTLSNVPVAKFRLGDGTVAPGAITALINWGDGTKSVGTITRSGTTYTVHGSHTYREEGVYIVSITVSYGNASATIRALALILEEPPHHGRHHHHDGYFWELFGKLGMTR